ncbi:MAG: STN and carboxypeptidase regulatory-like domain-containing protein [Salinivirgaceae bacterium]|jgi:hypothetical protein|nr:STN and carboxypeptidase regulatory-like domain-containing protein [Salinivirgaceae bacterium]
MIKVAKHSYILLLFTLFLASSAWAQTNHLNKIISISVTNTSIEELLILISKQGKFNFSYNADIVNGDSVVTFEVNKTSVEKTLNVLFKKRVRYKVVNDHIILLRNYNIQKTGKQSRKSMSSTGYTLTGYVLDANTGQALQNATIYEVDGKISAITNSQGFYMMVLPPDRQFRGVNYCRYDYIDSILFIRPYESMQLDVALKPRHIKIQKIQSKTTLLEPDLKSTTIVNWLVPEEAVTTAKNIRLPELNSMQISLLPFLGSDYKLSGTKTNNLSLNILAGYTGAVDGLELGGGINIVQNDVKGAQLAGFGNVVGKNTRGAQLAGFFNINNGSVTGAQIAGFQNTLNGEMHGVQLSGFNNVTTQNVDGIQATGFVNVAFKDVNMAQLSGFVNYGRNIGGLQATGFVNMATGNVEAAQLAGFVNLSRDVNGLQAAGFVNIANGNIGAAQLAGFVNYCDSVTGAQLAGYVNFARLNVTALQGAGFVNYGSSVTGAQLAGFTNICLNENKGVQISGFLNYAHTLNGLQLAFANFADTVESGLPVGFFSFVRRGYHVVDFSADESFRTNYAFKTGVKKFYNIFKYGRGKNNTAHFAYGLGYLKSFDKHHAVSLDFTTSMISNSDVEEVLMGLMVRFNPTYSYSIFKHLTVFAGPSLNIYGATAKNFSNDFSSIDLYPIWEQTQNDIRMQMWVGLTLGIRI